MDMFGLNRQHERDTPLHEISLFMMPKQSESKKSALKLLGTQANDHAVEDNRETPDLLIRGWWTGCRSLAISGPSMIVQNGFKLRPAFLASSTDPVMTSTRS